MLFTTLRTQKWYSECFSSITSMDLHRNAARCASFWRGAHRALLWNAVHRVSLRSAAHCASLWKAVHRAFDCSRLHSRTIAPLSLSKSLSLSESLRTDSKSTEFCTLNSSCAPSNRTSMTLKHSGRSRTANLWSNTPPRNSTDKLFLYTKLMSKLF